MGEVCALALACLTRLAGLVALACSGFLRGVAASAAVTATRLDRCDPVTMTSLKNERSPAISDTEARRRCMPLLESHPFRAQREQRRSASPLA